MKSIITLAVILHLCYSFNTDLQKEIITKLIKLNEKLKSDKYLNTANSVYVPSKYMSENLQTCAGLFFRELRVILSNLPERYGASVTLLLANLDTVGPLPVNTSQCQMATMRSKQPPIDKYIHFIRKLIKGRISL